MWQNRFWFHHNLEAGELLESSIISSVITILSVRFFLFLTGFPQVTIRGLHIAHVLWGGLFMFASVVILLAFIGKNARFSGAILGGIGFGLFIDELGKFVTQDNNYFFQPTITLIYFIFIILFYLSRYLSNETRIAPRDYLMNSLQLLEEAVINDMEPSEKRKLDNLLKKSQEYSLINTHIQAISDELVLAHPTPKTKIQKYLSKISRNLHRFTKAEFFEKLVVFVFLTRVLISLFNIILAYVLNIHNLENTLGLFSEQYEFITWGQFISTIVSFILALIGVYFLRKGNKRKEFIFFKYSILVTLLITQFFVFYRDQFSAVFGLSINIILLIGLNILLNRERNS